MTLPEGDYELAVSFSSPQATGNYGAYLDQVSLLGVKVTQVGRSYDSAISQSKPIGTEGWQQFLRNFFPRYLSHTQRVPWEAPFVLKIS